MKGQAYSEFRFDDVNTERRNDGNNDKKFYRALIKQEEKK